MQTDEEEPSEPVEREVEAKQSEMLFKGVGAS